MIDLKKLLDVCGAEIDLPESWTTIALVIPISTATCERAMNCIKTDLRNRLSISVLDWLMRISIELENFKEIENI